MKKLLEYVAVAVVAVIGFCLLVNACFVASRGSLEKDCKAMGQYRSGGLLIECRVVTGGAA